MVTVKIVIRKLGGKKPDYSLQFDLPEMPRVGDYISVHRPETKLKDHGEDLIVRHVWWRLEHLETLAQQGSEQLGNVREIVVECDMPMVE